MVEYNQNNTFQKANETISSPPVPRWNNGTVESPVNCTFLQIVGILSVFLFALSLGINNLLLWLFYKHKSLRSPMNTLVITHTIFNVICAILEWPIVIGSHLFCR